MKLPDLLLAPLFSLCLSSFVTANIRAQTSQNFSKAPNIYNALGFHLERNFKGDFESKPGNRNEDIGAEIHDHIQGYIASKDTQAQLHALEPSIRAHLADGAAGVIVEVRMFGAGNGFDQAHAYILGWGQDFVNAYLSGLQQPAIDSFNIPGVMSDPDSSHLIWVESLGGSLLYTEFPEGWNTSSTVAGRENLAARAAGRFQFYARCVIPKPGQDSGQATASTAVPGAMARVNPHLPPHGGLETASERETDHTASGSKPAPQPTKPPEVKPEKHEVQKPTSKPSEGKPSPPNQDKPVVIIHMGLVAEASAASSATATPSITVTPLSPATEPQALASVSGVVTDTNGIALEGATVTLTLVAFIVPGVVQSSTTDASGSFHFSGLVHGDWGLDVRASGWDDYVHFLHVTGNSATNLTITMLPLSENYKMDWGVPGTRAWVDLVGDHLIHFCRVVRNDTDKMNPQQTMIIVCSGSSGPRFEQLYQGALRVFSIPRQEWDSSFAWVDVTGDHHLSLCRAVPSRPNSNKGSLACTVWQEPPQPNMQITTPQDMLIDLGLSSGRSWVDINGDGKADFCTLIVTDKQEHKIACWLREGDAFSRDPVVSQDVHWQEDVRTRLWTDINNDGKMAFCTVAGRENEFLDCTLFAAARFGPTVRDLIKH